MIVSACTRSSKPPRCAVVVSSPLPTPAAPDEQGEFGGRDGLDPVRYGDWEVKGLAVDF